MFPSPTSTSSSSITTLDTPYHPSGIKSQEELEFYLDDLQGTYRWVINNKRLTHQVQYCTDQAYLRAGETHTLRAFFTEQLGEISSPLKLILEYDPSSQFTLKARSYAIWELKIQSSSTTHLNYFLVRRVTGWDFHTEGPNGPLIGSFSKRPGEIKLGRLRFNMDLEEGTSVALIFSLTFAISTANARFHKELGIPASTEFDRIDKYGDLAEYRPTVKPSTAGSSVFTRTKLLSVPSYTTNTASNF